MGDTSRTKIRDDKIAQQLGMQLGEPGFESRWQPAAIMSMSASRPIV